MTHLKVGQTNLQEKESGKRSKRTTMRDLNERGTNSLENAGVKQQNKKQEATGTSSRSKTRML